MAHTTQKEDEPPATDTEEWLSFPYLPPSGARMLRMTEATGKKADAILGAIARVFTWMHQEKKTSASTGLSLKEFKKICGFPKFAQAALDEGIIALDSQGKVRINIIAKHVGYFWKQRDKWKKDKCEQRGKKGKCPRGHLAGNPQRNPLGSPPLLHSNNKKEEEEKEELATSEQHEAFLSELHAMVNQ